MESGNRSKVLLYNPDWRALSTPGRFRVDVPYFPLELMYIEAGLRSCGISSVMGDMWGGSISRNDFDEALLQANYIVLTTAPTYVFWRDGVCDVEYSRQIINEIRAKNSSAKIIVIGPQGTVLPKDFEGMPIDFLVRGEPDWAVPELIQKLENGETEINMAGVCPVVDGELQIVESKTEMRPMETLSRLDFESISDGHYGQVVYETSRGCVYDCAFCCRDGFRQTMRYKPMDHIRAELEQIRDRGYQYVFFIDELFGPQKKWHHEFCEMIKPMGLKWSVQTRQECLSPERIEHMISAGCVSIEIGLESADPAVAKRIGKNSNLEKLTEVILKACELDIEQQIRLFCIIGSPGESLESVGKTTEFLMRFVNQPRVQADLHPMIPIPGTQVWDLGRKLGLELNTWQDVTRYIGIVDNDFRETSEVENLCKSFMKRWNYEREKDDLSKSFAGRMALLRMRLTMKFPALSGMRERVFGSTKSSAGT